MKFVLSAEFPELNLRDRKRAEVSILPIPEFLGSNSLNPIIPEPYQKASSANPISYGVYAATSSTHKIDH